MKPHHKAIYGLAALAANDDFYDSLTGWNPGYVAFIPDTADVDTITRIRGGRAVPIDMRGHMKLRAATIADWCIVTSMQKNT